MKKKHLKIKFVKYIILLWKFGKCKRKRWRMSANFVWVKILQKIVYLTVIVDKFWNFSQNVY